MHILAEAAERAGLDATGCVQLETDSAHDVAVQIADLKVSVVQSIPFAEDDYLQVALDTFSLENFIKGDQRIADAVTACTHVSIQPVSGDNVTALNGADAPMAGDQPVFEDTGSALRAMSLAKAIVTGLLEEADSVSVFWGPSTFLLDPDTFRRLAAAKEELLLYLHCHLFSEDDPKTGQTLTGVVAAGAQWLVGRYVEIKPCPQPPEYLVEKVYDFVRTALKSDSIGTDGLSFGRDDDERIQIQLEPSEGYAPGRILLQVMQGDEQPLADDDEAEPSQEPSAQVGEDTDPVPLDPPPAPAQQRLPATADFRDFDDEDAELDPDNPVDAAIMQRLAELNEAGPDDDDNTADEDVSAPIEDVSAPVEDAPVPVVTEPAPEPAAAIVVEEMQDTVEATPGPRPRKPQPQRMSMAELRNFAKEAQVAQKDRDVSTKKRGFIGKMFNGKTG
nr:hypothetical protein [uncultured Roseibium sp.]